MKELLKDNEVIILPGEWEFKIFFSHAKSPAKIYDKWLQWRKLYSYKVLVKDWKIDESTP